MWLDEADETGVGEVDADEDPVTDADVNADAASDPAADDPRTSRPRRRRIIRAAVVVIAALLAILTADAVAAYRSLERVDVAVPDVSDGVTTWLLIGSDSREVAGSMPDPDSFRFDPTVRGERADVLILVQEPHDGEPARMMSIPRDLVVHHPGRGPERIALTLLASVDDLVASVCGTLGVAVDHIALVHFDGIARLVDVVGGVELDLPHRTRDFKSDYELPAGRTVIDGQTAVAWVRSRHAEQFIDGEWVADERDDGNRRENQRKLLRAVSRQASARLRRPWQARPVVRTVVDAVTVDADAGVTDLVRLFRTLASGPDEETLEHHATPGDIPVAVMVPDSAEQLDGFRSGHPDPSPCPRARPQPMR